MVDCIIIGGGPAGLAAACAAWEKGLTKILILERDKELGGILNQCIHNGFGVKRFGEAITGPEYADRYEQLLAQTGVEVKTDTMVLRVDGQHRVEAVNPVDGYVVYEGKTIILAMGCRERTRGAIAIPGSRPAGIFSAGTAQRYMNIDGYQVGKKVLILGSGDIGLIMARRLTLEGAQVLACVELMPYSSGLRANIARCLEDFDIPLMLSHTVTNIRGKNRVEGVTVAQVDENLRPIPGTEQDFECDTLLLSVGLLPENELSKNAGIQLDRRTRGAVVFENRECSIPGIFACGNVLHVHDLVDFVSEEAQLTGQAAADYVLNGPLKEDAFYTVEPGEGISYTVPQKIHHHCEEKTVRIYMRVRRICPKADLVLYQGEREVQRITKQFLAPGEMETFDVNFSLLDPSDESHIRVTMEE